MRRLATAASGAVAGVCATRWLDATPLHAQAPASPPICGAYELTSVWTGHHESAAVDSAEARAEPLRDKRRQCTPRRMSGLLVYQPDGRMWTQCSVERDDGTPASYTGFGGRWWLHNFSSYGNTDQVELFVKSASDPELVGKTVLQQARLSDDGNRLTTTDVKILWGERQVVEQLEWKRIGV